MILNKILAHKNIQELMLFEFSGYRQISHYSVTVLPKEQFF